MKIFKRLFNSKDRDIKRSSHEDYALQNNTWWFVKTPESVSGLSIDNLIAINVLKQPNNIFQTGVAGTLKWLEIWFVDDFTNRVTQIVYIWSEIFRDVQNMWHEKVALKKLCYCDQMSARVFDLYNIFLFRNKPV